MGLARVVICLSILSLATTGFAEQFNPFGGQGQGQQPQQQFGPGFPQGFQGGAPGQQGFPGQGQGGFQGQQGGFPGQQGGFPGQVPGMQGRGFPGMQAGFPGQQGFPGMQGQGFPGQQQPQQEAYDPNVGAQESGDGYLVTYQAPKPIVLFKSRMAAKHLRRHAAALLETCDDLRGNRDLVSQIIAKELRADQGYVGRAVRTFITGSNAPKIGERKQGEEDLIEFAYPICWWASELRTQAARAVEGVSLTMQTTVEADRAQKDPQYKIYPGYFANIRRMNIAAHEAIASGYLYVAALDRTCFTDRRADSNQMCKGNPDELKSNLRLMEAKLYAIRNILDALRQFPNMSNQFGECVECKYAPYRYNPGSSKKQNFVPFPFYEAQDSDANAGNPLVVYRGKYFELPDIKITSADDSERYKGQEWSEAWALLDTGYLRPGGPNSSQVDPRDKSRSRKRAGDSGLPLDGILATPAEGFDRSTTDGNPNSEAQVPESDLQKPPVPAGDVDPSAPLIRE